MVCITAGEPESRWYRLQKYIVGIYHELLTDLTEEPVDIDGRDPDGDQLAVKQSVFAVDDLDHLLLWPPAS